MSYTSTISLHRPDYRNTEFESVVFNSKRFFAVEPGDQFIVRVTMPAFRGPVRREIVLALDGRDVLVNEPANFNLYRGLVSDTTVVDFKGWRVSDSEVRAFVAESLGYGLTTSEKNNGAASARGTIAAAIFQEHAPYVALQAVSRRPLESSCGPTRSGGSGWVSHGPSEEHERGGLRAMPKSASAAAPVPAPSVGTKAGHAIVDKVGQTTFIRKTTEPELVEIEYDSKANLIRRGIWPATRREPVSNAWAGMQDPQFCNPRKL